MCALPKKSVCIISNYLVYKKSVLSLAYVVFLHDKNLTKMYLMTYICMTKKYSMACICMTKICRFKTTI